MPTPLKTKLFSAAAAYAPLQALLGTSPFRWSEQLVQGTAFPAVIVFIVSNPRVYAVTGRMASSWVRVQFTIFGGGNDSTNADAVAQALLSFLDSTNFAGLPAYPANPNTVVGDRDGGIAATQPATYQRMIDAMIFNNELL